MKYGLVTKGIDAIEYLLGNVNVPYIHFNPSGNWEKWLPKYENQTTKIGQETSGCTVWGSQNQIEILYKYLYGEEPNYSERFTYLGVPINPQKGADPHNTYETIRSKGLVQEYDLPMTDTLEGYLDRSDITGSLLAKGQRWLQQHDFKHEWVYKTKPKNYIELLKDALRTSPIGVSVSAWNLVGDEYVSNQGSVNNHFCVLYKIDKDGHPWIFDSYDHSKKKLSKDHNIRRAKRIFLQRKTTKEMELHIKVLKSIVNMLTNQKDILAVCEQYLGKDASPENKTDSEVACAETVSYLLNQAYGNVPTITGTYTLYEYLCSPRNGFIPVIEAVPGDVIISPTGKGKGIGHTGIVGENGIIMSNNSFGLFKGKFTKNYTIETWKERYAKKQNMPVFYFRKA